MVQTLIDHCAFVQVSFALKDCFVLFLKKAPLVSSNSSDLSLSKNIPITRVKINWSDVCYPGEYLSKINNDFLNS